MDQPKNLEVDKFVLRALSHLAYNREINELLAANIFLGFPKFYTLEKSLKRVNLKNLWSYFPKIIFQDAKDKQAADNLISFSTSMMMATSIFDNHHYRMKET